MPPFMCGSDIRPVTSQLQFSLDREFVDILIRIFYRQDRSAVALLAI